VYYERHGPVDGGAPPVLLLHGLDLPGHQRSALPAGRLTVERMAADVERLLVELGEPPVHVAGLSLGACVGLAASPASGPRAREAFGGWWCAWRSPPRRR